VTRMSYENIAQLVHDLVKNPKSMLSRELGLSLAELKTNEINYHTKFFFRVRGVWGCRDVWNLTTTILGIK